MTGHFTTPAHNTLVNRTCKLHFRHVVGIRPLTDHCSCSIFYWNHNNQSVSLDCRLVKFMFHFCLLNTCFMCSALAIRWIQERHQHMLRVCCPLLRQTYLCFEKQQQVKVGGCLRTAKPFLCFYPLYQLRHSINWNGERVAMALFNLFCWEGLCQNILWL